MAYSHLRRRRNSTHQLSRVESRRHRKCEVVITARLPQNNTNNNYKNNKRILIISFYSKNIAKSDVTVLISVTWTVLDTKRPKQL